MCVSVLPLRTAPTAPGHRPDPALLTRSEKGLMYLKERSSIPETVSSPSRDSKKQQRHVEKQPVGGPHLIENSQRKKPDDERADLNMTENIR